MKITGVVAFVAAAASVVSAVPIEGRATDNISLGSLNTGSRLANGALQVASNVLVSAAGIAANGINTATDLAKNGVGLVMGGDGNRNGFNPLGFMGSRVRAGRLGF